MERQPPGELCRGKGSLVGRKGQHCGKGKTVSWAGGEEAYPKKERSGRGAEADGDCPDTHPVRLPQIKLYTRIEPYLGGIHLFSDGTGDFHADYFSGWDSDFLQSVLDECENEFWVSASIFEELLSSHGARPIS